MPSESIVRLEQVCRRFQSGGQTITVLDHLSFSLDRGQRIAIMGASGSGKSTLLHLVAGMDHPDSGEVWLGDSRLDRLAEPARTRLRARRIGLVFQDFNLIEALSVRDNIAMVMWLNGLDERSGAIEALADRLEIGHLLDRLPEQLSGGEKQRAAIARALIHQPDLLLADEPTGALDPTTADRVLDLFDEAVDRAGCTLLMVTHNQAAADRLGQVWRLDRGQLQPC